MSLLIGLATLLTFVPIKSDRQQLEPAQHLSTEAGFKTTVEISLPHTLALPKYHHRGYLPFQYSYIDYFCNSSIRKLHPNLEVDHFFLMLRSLPLRHISFSPEATCHHTKRRQFPLCGEKISI